MAVDHHEPAYSRRRAEGPAQTGRKSLSARLGRPEHQGMSQTAARTSDLAHLLPDALSRRGFIRGSAIGAAGFAAAAVAACAPSNLPASDVQPPYRDPRCAGRGQSVRLRLRQPQLHRVARLPAQLERLAWITTPPARRSSIGSSAGSGEKVRVRQPAAWRHGWRAARRSSTSPSIRSSTRSTRRSLRSRRSASTARGRGHGSR